MTKMESRRGCQPQPACESVEARKLDKSQATLAQRDFQSRLPIRIWPAEALTGIAARQHPAARAHQDTAIRQVAEATPGPGASKALHAATVALAQWEATNGISKRWATHVLLANAARLRIRQAELRAIIAAGWAEGAQLPRCVYLLPPALEKSQ